MERPKTPLIKIMSLVVAVFVATAGASRADPLPGPDITDPLPGPDVLCPAQGMPAGWRSRCLAGHMAYAPTLTGGLLPEVGNGHIATVVQSDTIYAAGLFNGDAMAKLARSTYRARIPAFKVDVLNQSTDGVRAMDFERALFKQIRNVTAGGALVTVEDTWYAPYQQPRLLVHEISLSLVVGSGAVVALRSLPSAPSSDLSLHPVASAAPDEYVVAGNNTLPGDGHAIRIDATRRGVMCDAT